MDQARKNLKEHFWLPKTIPRTRGFHKFVPLRQNGIGVKEVSENKDFAFGSSVVSMYENHHWLGIVYQINNENKDVEIKFMYPHVPAHSFDCPSREDICWVHDVNVLVVVDIPVPSTRT